MKTRCTLLLILLSALLAAMLAAFSACDSVDFSNEKTLVSITAVNVPERITSVSEFDSAGIKLRLNYSDDTSEQIPLTENMRPKEYREILL